MLLILPDGRTILAPGSASSARKRLLIGLAAILFSRVPPALGQPEVYAADLQQKAGLICNFLRNFTWPERRFNQPDAPFIVGILGSNDIGEYLSEDIQDRRIQGRPVRLRRISHPEELPACHLVFVGRSERNRLRQILGRLRRAGALTVGESDNFLASGGMIQFTNDRGQVRYLISLEAARRERIEPNGFVLRMSTPRS